MTLKNIFVYTTILLAILSFTAGLYLVKNGLEQTGYAIEFGVDIGGRTYECVNSTCSAAGFTNPEILTESEYMSRQAMFLSLATFGYNMMLIGAMMCLGGVGMSLLTIMAGKEK